MDITIKEPAMVELEKLTLNPDEGIRIEAIFVGNCSLYIDHYLWIDQKSSDDEEYMVNAIPFIVSSESKKHLPEKLILDYNPRLGYKLASNEETFKYNLSIKRR